MNDHEIELDLDAEECAALVSADILQIAENIDDAIIYEPTVKGLQYLQEWLNQQVILECPSCDLPMIAGTDYICPNCRDKDT